MRSISRNQRLWQDICKDINIQCRGDTDRSCHHFGLISAPYTLQIIQGLMNNVFVIQTSYLTFIALDMHQQTPGPTKSCSLSSVHSKKSSLSIDSQWRSISSWSEQTFDRECFPSSQLGLPPAARSEQLKQNTRPTSATLHRGPYEEKVCLFIFTNECLKCWLAIWFEVCIPCSFLSIYQLHEMPCEDHWFQRLGVLGRTTYYIPENCLGVLRRKYSSIYQYLSMCLCEGLFYHQRLSRCLGVPKRTPYSIPENWLGVMRRKYSFINICLCVFVRAYSITNYYLGV